MLLLILHLKNFFLTKLVKRHFLFILQKGHHRVGLIQNNVFSMIDKHGYILIAEYGIFVIFVN